MTEQYTEAEIKEIKKTNSINIALTNLSNINQLTQDDRLSDSAKLHMIREITKYYRK